MQKFHYEAFDGTGKLIEGEIEAPTADEVRELVWSRGATPFLVRTAQASDILFRDIRFDRTSRLLSDARLATLIRDLAVLLQSGVELESALRIASTTCEDRSMRSLALKLRDGLLKGSSLADVMRGFEGAFREEYLQIVRSGELSGDLGGALHELANLIERRVEIVARVRASMTYPVLLIVLAFVSLSVVLGLLVPAVTPIFQENNMELPRVIGFLDALRRNAGAIGLIGLALLVGSIAAIVLAKRRPSTRQILDRLRLRIPIIGNIGMMREAARFTRTLATLLRAGVPLLSALEASHPLVKNEHTRLLLVRATEQVREGAGLAAAVANSAALPSIAIQMISVGEESGRLSDMLMRAALIFERQEQSRTERALAVLTPAITILVAGMVAAIILSVMSAIMSMNELVLR